MELSDHVHFSRQLYVSLCQVIGSEEVVYGRRIFFQIIDDVLSQDFKTFISSGSKAEGLNMAGSDFDFMTVIKDIPVFHDMYESRCSFGVLTDTEHASPGFVLLKDISGIIASEFITISEYGPVISNEKFKAKLLERACRKAQGLKCHIIHGPCVKFKARDYDKAYCLKSQEWPKIAGNYLKRPRFSRWPSSSVMRRMVSGGLIFVPIGSKFGGKEGNPIEWRISFSIQEKMLVHSFNHTQLMCYALLKLILKEVINTQNHVSNLLCSYFLKTTVFWLSEETDPSEWKPDRMFLCFKTCIQRLIYWVRMGYCPNYFIPENNMFAGKIYGQQKKDVLSVLNQINARAIHVILELPSLSNLILGEVVLSNYGEKHDIDVGIYPLCHKFMEMLSPSQFSCDLLSLLLNKIRRQSSRLCKSLYFHSLAHWCIKLVIEMAYDWQCKNKDFHQQYKQMRFFAQIGTNINPVSGWLWFASFLYQHGDYHGALIVTSSLLPECRPDKYYVTLTGTEKIDLDILTSRTLTFNERHKLSCIYEIAGYIFADSMFYKSALNMFSAIFAPPIVYLHFLRFICFHRLGNISERNRCIKDIQQTIENDFFVDTVWQHRFSYFYWLKALEISEKSSTTEWWTMSTDDKSLWSFMQFSNDAFGDILNL